MKVAKPYIVWKEGSVITKTCTSLHPEWAAEEYVESRWTEEYYPAPIFVQDPDDLTITKWEVEVETQRNFYAREIV